MATKNNFRNERERLSATVTISKPARGPNAGSGSDGGIG